VVVSLPKRVLLSGRGWELAKPDAAALRGSAVDVIILPSIRVGFLLYWFTVPSRSNQHANWGAGDTNH